MSEYTPMRMNGIKPADIEWAGSLRINNVDGGQVVAYPGDEIYIRAWSGGVQGWNYTSVYYFTLLNEDQLVTIA